MKFAFTLLPIAAAIRFVGAGPVSAENLLTKRAPVPVTNLVCDGITYQCTAFLDFDDGNWIAQWGSSMFYEGHFGSLTEKPMTSIGPAPVTGLTCDGKAHKCTARLDLGDGHWVAQWDADVVSQGLFSHEDVVGTMTLGPVPVKKLTCDGDPNWQRCTAYLVWSGGNWVAQWGINVYHQGSFL